MVGHGGTKTVAVLLSGLLLALGMSGYEYTDAGDTQLASRPTRGSQPRAPLPTKDQATVTRTGLAPQDQTFDCSARYARVVQLQPGPVTVQVQVARADSGNSTPAGAGEVAAVRITANG